MVQPPFLRLAAELKDMLRLPQLVLDPAMCTKPFPLLSLPAELLRTIVSLCLTAELKSLRLSCKKTESFASEFLHKTVYLDLLPESFDRVSAISNHARFPTTVRTVYFIPQRFTEYKSIERFKHDCFARIERDAQDLDVAKMSQMSDEEWSTSYRDYTYFCDNQLSLVEGTKLRTLLSRVFVKLPKLDSIVIPASVHFTDAEDNFVLHTSLMQKVVQRTLLRPRTPTDGYLDIWSVLVAVAAARVKLKHAWFDYLPDVFFESHILAALEAQSTFSSLRSLKLTLAPLVFGKLRDLSTDSFQRLMAQCQQLRHLRVEAEVPLRLTVAVIGLSLPWEHLQSLTLVNIMLFENELADFLIAHQPTLCWFKTRACPLKAGAWESLSKRLQPHLPASIEASNKCASFASKDWPLHLTPIWGSRKVDDRELDTPFNDMMESEDAEA